MAAADKLLKQAQGSALKGQAAKLGLTQKTSGDRDFLFCIPVQIGPPTPYAKNVLHWMHTIILIQVIALILRILVLWDLTGGLWMILTIGLGAYAIYQDLNITYVCVWGLACSLQGFTELLGLLLPFILPAFPNLNFVQLVIRAIIMLTYLCGALLTRHLYHDYAQQQNLPSNFLTAFDPLGHYVDTYDPEEKMPILGQGYSKLEHTAQQAATAGTAAATAGVAEGMKQTTSIDAAKAGLLGALTSSKQLLPPPIEAAPAVAQPAAAAAPQPSMMQSQTASIDAAKAGFLGALTSAPAAAKPSMDAAALAADTAAQQAQQQAQQAHQSWLGGLKNAQGIAVSQQQDAQQVMKQTQGLAASQQQDAQAFARSAAAQGKQDGAVAAASMQQSASSMFSKGIGQMQAAQGAAQGAINKAAPPQQQV